VDGRLQYRDRVITLGISVRDEERLLGRADGTVRADLAFERRDRRLLDDPVDVKVIADSLPMNPIELAFQTLQDVEGYVRGEVIIGGRPGAFDYRGSLTFEDVEATLPALGIRLLDIRGDVAFEGSDAVPDTVRFTSSAGGSGFVTGRVGLSTLTNPEFDLDIGADALRGMERRQLTMTLTGAGNLGGTYKQPILTGAFRVSDGELRGDYFLRQRQVVDLTDPEVFALIDTTTAGERNLLRRAQNLFLQEILVNVQLTVGPSYRVRSREYEIELVGDVDIQMQRSKDLLIASGVLQLTRGKYQYFAGRGEDLTSVYSRQLQISGGTVTFVRTPGLDPNLAIRAEYPTRSDVGPLTILLDIGGTSRSPELHLSSNPPVPESDLLCLLLFSASCAGAGTEGGQFAENIVREGILGTVGTQFSQVLVGDIGLVDYADFRSTGLGLGSSGGSGSTLLVGTEVEVGRYVGRDLFVRVRQPLGGGQLPSAALEWTFLPGWLLEASAEDRFQRLSILSSLSNVNTKRSYGLFLKREWSF
jgi:autotransporter translocation and assembly factor TamB